MPSSTLAIDLGGTKIDLCRMLADGTIVWRKRIATKSLEPGSLAFLDRVINFVAEHVSDDDHKIGVSWNTPVHEGRLTRASLLGGPVDVDLRKAFGDRFNRPIQVESDVHAMALGEHAFGVKDAFASFLLINMGSGFGVAYHDGELMRGHSGGAGTVWQEQHYVPELGESIILDRLLSGRGLSLLYHRLGGRELTGAEVVTLAGDDPIARDVLAIVGRHLGRFIVSMCRTFNPSAIVLTGSVALSSHLFLPKAKASVETELESYCRPEALLTSSLDASACLGLL